ncbi:MAG: phosphotransferase [Ilumatobacter sp.]|uniref:phosphotransferase n=1 Tax=Ilumatobacter sp. TaxID=1967498 RepID=UPI003C739D89
MTDVPGPLLASGRAADVYDIGDGKVLRRYRTRPSGAELDAALEARAMAHVRARGYPVPEVHDVDGVDLVMDRIDGPTMLEALEAAPWKVIWHARVLARLQRKLARIAAPDWMLAASADADHAQSVLHLDLHPMNVILSSKGPVVIDWTNAAGGPQGFDGALTFVEISTFPTDGLVDRIGQQVFARSFRWFRGKRVIAPFLKAACDHRLGDSGLLPEERVAVAALRRRLAT